MQLTESGASAPMCTPIRIIGSRGILTGASILHWVPLPCIEGSCRLRDGHRTITGRVEDNNLAAITRLRDGVDKGSTRRGKRAGPAIAAINAGHESPRGKGQRGR